MSHSIARIDAEALRHNLRHLRSLAPGCSTFAVVKADAYGHGMEAVADILAPHTERFAVAQVAEGERLRRAGIAHPILVFAPPRPGDGPRYRAAGLIAAVCGPESLEHLPPGTEYHVNVDTGMRRAGVAWDRMEEMRTAMGKRPDLEYTGLYTHFATAEQGAEGFALQSDRFGPWADALGRGVLVHAANSGTLMCRTTARYDAIRPGIALYGIDPHEEQGGELKPAMTWTTALIQVKRIRKGEGLSYGWAWAAPADGWYGVVPVGYADGLPRALSGRISFRSGGRVVPQVGIITMDACMVWLGDDPLPAGAEIVLFDAEAAHLRAWAHTLGTISYELLCGVGARVERRYLNR